MIAGCASKAVSKNPAQPTPDKNTQSQQSIGLPATAEVISEPIIACEYYSKSDTTSQKKQWSESQQVLNKNKQDLLHRIKLACMYTLPNSFSRDLAKAQPLLQQLRDDQSIENAEKALIYLLYLFNTENIKQQQKGRDDARALENLTQKYEMLEKKYEASEQKLQRLKNIEKNLNVR